MKSKASAPGKVILFGEHFVVYGIKSILCSINKRVTVTAEKTKERKISINSGIGKLVLEPNQSISKIDSPLKPFYYLANKAIKDQNEGLEIEIESEIPLGAGLGSSSACCVAGAAGMPHGGAACDPRTLRACSSPIRCHRAGPVAKGRG